MDHLPYRLHADIVMTESGQWRNDGVAAASSDGDPTDRGAPTKREKARGGPDLRK